MGNKKIRKIKAQVSLEFTAAFIVLLIFLIAATKLFVWFGNNIVNRHKAYEETRIYAGNPGSWSSFDNIHFYDQSQYPLKIFEEKK